MIEYFARYFFIVPLQIAMNLLFVAACIIHFKKLKVFAILLAYGMSSLIQSAIGVYFNVFEKTNDRIDEILEGSINIFLLIEFNVFAFYVFCHLGIKNFKNIVALSALSFSCFTIFLWFQGNFFTEPSAYLGVMGSFLTIGNCLLFFYDKLVIKRTFYFTNHPSFFAITGILFLSIFLSVLSIYVSHPYRNLSLIYDIVYAMNCFSYTMLFTFFIKALKCQINTQQ